MEIIEVRCLRIVIFTIPYVVYKIVTSNCDKEFWWFAFPALLLIFVSIIIPKFKWFFRYVAPLINLATINYYYNESGKNTPSNKEENIGIWEVFIINMPLIQLYNISMNEVVGILYNLIFTIGKYNLKRLALYVLLCILHSFVFIVICNEVSINIGSFTQNIQECLRSSQVYTEVILPRRKASELHNLRQQHDRIHSFDIVDPLDNRNKLFQGSFVTLNDFHRLPYCIKSTYLVPGEDTILSCNITLKLITLELHGNLSNSVSFSDTKYEWRINNKKMRNALRFKFRNFCDQFQICFFQIDIEDVQPHEFDQEITLWAYRLTLLNSTKVLLKIKLGIFFIFKQPKYVTYVHVPEGHIAYFENLVVLSLPNSEIVIRQQIDSFSSENQLDISNVCTERFEGCSPLVSFAQNITKKFPKLNTVYSFPNLRLSDGQAFMSASCICKAAFGIHTFIVQRYHYESKADNKYSISEFELPYQIIVLPTGLTKFFDQSYQELRKDVIELLATNENWKRSWRFFKNDEWNSFIWENLQYVVLFCVPFEFMMVLVAVIKIYNYIFVRPFAKKLLQILNEEQEVDADVTFGNFCDKTEIVYDMMIVNTVEDNLFVDNCIVPIIDERGINFTTSHSYANPGQLEIQTNAEAVESSRHFIVVASEHFINDRLYNDCVFSRFIVPRIYTDEVQNSRILVVVVDGINIPNAIRMNNRVIKWSRNESREENTRSLNRELDSILCNQDKRQLPCTLI